MFFSWKEIGTSIFRNATHHRYFSYNKGGIYIAIVGFDCSRQYFKFDLSQKTLIEIACYGEHAALRNSEGKLEALKFDGQDFLLNPDYAVDLTNERYLINYLRARLEGIERFNQKIEIDPTDTNNYIYKGICLCNLERYFDAIECHNKVIEIDPNHDEAYLRKGEAFHKMGRNLEAIECYNQATIICGNPNTYLAKGLVLDDLNRYQEAMECYEKVMTWWDNDSQHHRGGALYSISKYGRELEHYNKVYTGMKEYFKNDISIARTLSELDRKQEAIEWYANLINSKPGTFFFYCCRACVLNDVEREEEAMQDFNQAYYWMPIRRTCFKDEEFPYNYIDETAVQDFYDLMKMICKLEENAVKFKEEIQKFKDTKNVEFLKEVEEKEALVKKMRSKILKNAVECLDSSKSVSIETIQQVEKEAADHIKATINVCAHLSSLIST